MRARPTAGPGGPGLLDATEDEYRASSGPALQQIATAKAICAQPGAFRACSIVKHGGPQAGAGEHRNPVSAHPPGDGSVIAVLYGAGPNGSATSWRPAGSGSGRKATAICWNARRSPLRRKLFPRFLPCPAGCCGHATSRTSRGRTGRNHVDPQRRGPAAMLAALTPGTWNELEARRPGLALVSARAGRSG